MFSDHVWNLKVHLPLSRQLVGPPCQVLSRSAEDLKSVRFFRKRYGTPYLFGESSPYSFRKTLPYNSKTVYEILIKTWINLFSVNSLLSNLNGELKVLSNGKHRHDRPRFLTE